MKFTVQKSILLDALTITGKCISKCQLPIMESYLFRVNKKQLDVIGSNLEVFLQKQVDINSDITETITLPSARLFNLIKELPDQPLEFTIEKSGTDKDEAITVNIRASCGTYIIPATNGIDYYLQENKGDIAFEIDSEDMLEGISRTMFACGGDPLRPALSGVLISFEETGVTYTGTNANVLSTCTYKADVDSTKSFIVPVKVLSILTGLVPNTKIQVKLDDKSIVFNVNNATVLKSRLIDEKYPDYKAIIPKDNDKILNINRTDLISSLKRVTMFCDDMQNTVRLDIGAEEINISSQNDLGELANETIANKYNGESTAVRFNGRALIGCLGNLSTELVDLSFKANNKAFLLRSHGDAAEELTNLMLLMPLVD